LTGDRLHDSEPIVSYCPKNGERTWAHLSNRGTSGSPVAYQLVERPRGQLFPPTLTGAELVKVPAAAPAGGCRGVIAPAPAQAPAATNAAGYLNANLVSERELPGQQETIICLADLGPSVEGRRVTFLALPGAGVAAGFSDHCDGPSGRDETWQLGQTDAFRADLDLDLASASNRCIKVRSVNPTPLRVYVDTNGAKISMGHKAAMISTP
jgi:hypothetical protein